MTKSKVRIIHDVVYMENIMRNWIKEYRPPGGKVISSQLYLDPVKGAVIVLLTIDYGIEVEEEQCS